MYLNGEYQTARQAADELHMDVSRITKLAKQRRIQGAVRVGPQWLIPKPVVILKGAGQKPIGRKRSGIDGPETAFEPRTRKPLEFPVQRRLRHSVTLYERHDRTFLAEVSKFDPPYQQIRKMEFDLTHAAGLELLAILNLTDVDALAVADRKTDEAPQ